MEPPASPCIPKQPSLMSGDLFMSKRTTFAMLSMFAVSCCLCAVAAAGRPAQQAAFPPPKNEPPIIVPGNSSSDPPSDAIVLFDGKDLSKWRNANNRNDAKWLVRDGYVQVVPETGDIATREEFGDCQLHIEWATPTEVKGEGQERGNSGVFFMERYEVQILDSYDNKTYYHGQAGAIYNQYAPLVNASRKPGEWQSYDIIFKAPKFDEQGK